MLTVFTLRSFVITIPNTGEVINTEIHNNFDTLLAEAMNKSKPLI